MVYGFDVKFFAVRNVKKNGRIKTDNWVEGFYSVILQETLQELSFYIPHFYSVYAFLKKYTSGKTAFGYCCKGQIIFSLF